MPNVLAIAPGTPPALEGRTLLGESLSIELRADPERAIAEAATSVYDLLVLVGMSVDQQHEVATRLQCHRRWRLVPVLYVLDERLAGISVPASYRPEMDGMARGLLDSVAVQRRIRSLAREGVAEADLVVAGPFELDPIHGRLRCGEVEISFTDREAEILLILLSQPNRTVTAEEIIERGWGMDADSRYLQILRRHVSNIRRKLHDTDAGRSVTTVRGAGYRFDLRLAS
ncbi:MAG: winged helix-turn-helix domain-containing protein [Anaerolineaceae bacterium]